MNSLIKRLIKKSFLNRSPMATEEVFEDLKEKYEKNEYRIKITPKSSITLKR